MTSDVERDIARTRGELALTLAELERKLGARYLANEGLNMLKDTLGDDYGLNRGLNIVRNNPLPVAMIGIGAAWLIASQTDAMDRIARDERIQAARRRVGDLASDLGNRAGDMASSAAQRIGIGGNGVGNGIDRPLGHTGNAMIDEPGSTMGGSGWVHQAQGMVRSARDSGGAMLDRASESAGRVADQVGDMLERHPLLMGALGMLAGGLIAALLPRTPVEDEWFGPARDQLWNQAEKAGEETVSRVRDVAMRAADAAADAAAETIQKETDKPLSA